MNDPTFRAKIRPELNAEAQTLVDVYERTYGSAGPGCCPEALAAVLDNLAGEAGEAIDMCGSISVIELLRMKAQLLRGQPDPQHFTLAPIPVSERMEGQS